MAFMNRRRNKQALARKIGTEAAPGNLECSLINLASPDFYSQNRFQLDNRKAGDERPRTRLLQNKVHVIGARLLVIQLRQRAGIEKIVCHSAFLPRSDDGLGKRAGDRGECTPYFVKRDVIVSGFSPFFGCEVSGKILAGSHWIGNGYSDLLPIFKRQGLQRLEHAVLVHGLKRLLHTVLV